MTLPTALLATMALLVTLPRRSLRLRRQLTNVPHITERMTSKRTKAECVGAKEKRRRKTPSESNNDNSREASYRSSLLRARERQLRLTQKNLFVMGVDEAGRGPLAGPVVAAAAIVPTDIPGITDSKRITNEQERERLYQEIVSSPGVRFALAIVSAQRIDEINILQATLEGMKMAVTALIAMDEDRKSEKEGLHLLPDNNLISTERMEHAYVVTGGEMPTSRTSKKSSCSECNQYYALVDGNKIPKDMPCPTECIIQGDAQEYSIAAASILAKVTRDRLMNQYDEIYPNYGLCQHKGYPTLAHREAVLKYGGSSIHRQTFAPLKYMNMDKNEKNT